MDEVARVGAPNLQGEVVCGGDDSVVMPIPSHHRNFQLGYFVFQRWGVAPIERVGGGEAQTSRDKFNKCLFDISPDLVNGQRVREGKTSPMPRAAGQTGVGGCSSPWELASHVQQDTPPLLLV